MQDFSCTMAISSLKSSKKECDTCKAIEIIKHNACKDMCLGNSEREQRLVAEKIKKTLSSPLNLLLSKIFGTKHEDITQRLSSLENSISNLHEISKELPHVASKISNVAPKLETDRRIKLLEEKLNRIEDVLNTRAAEIYDLKEQVQGLEIPKDDGVPIGDLTVYKEEIRKQLKTLEDRKWTNDQMKLDIIKFKKEKPVGLQKIKKEIDEDVSVIRKKNINFQKQIERLEILQKGISERTRLGLTTLDNLKEGIQIIQQEQRSIELLSPDDLIRITKNVFSSYSTMKKMKEITKNSTKNTLDKLSKIPALMPHIIEINQEIDRN
jgi:hypothetical protein